MGRAAMQKLGKQNAEMGTGFLNHRGTAWLTPQPNQSSEDDDEDEDEKENLRRLRKL
jgi:hypothetical protein